MQILSECNLEHNQNGYVCFVNFDKAFDRIRWDKLLEILKNIGVDWRDRKLISELYMSQTAIVRTDNGETPPIVVGRGTRQGRYLSPLLFNIYDEAMVGEAFDDIIIIIIIIIFINIIIIIKIFYSQNREKETIIIKKCL